jgi:acyl-coenzyme A thioesterase PaaI-like protein
VRIFLRQLSKAAAASVKQARETYDALEAETLLSQTFQQFSSHPYTTRAKIFFDRAASRQPLVGALKDGVGSMMARTPHLVDDLRVLVRNPRALGFYLEAQTTRLSPFAGRTFGRMLGKTALTVASYVTEPFTFGMGMQLEQMTEELVELSMPGGWRIRGEGGGVHHGALSAIGEHAARLYWDFHLDPLSATAESSRVQVRVLAPASGEMRAIFRLSETDREVLLHRMRAGERVEVETLTSIYDQAGKLVAEVEVEWRLSRTLVLRAPGRRSKGTEAIDEDLAMAASATPDDENEDSDERMEAT